MWPPRDRGGGLGPGVLGGGRPSRRPLRVLLWHGWLLEGSGSNVYVARSAAALRAAGHDVVLLCQEPRGARFPFVDAIGRVGPDGPAAVEPTGARPASSGGRVLLLRPDIGDLLPVFVVDRYEGFRVSRFVDLDAAELEAYLSANVAALRAAAESHPPDAVVAGHVVPGGVVALRALGPGRGVVVVHGSDLEYAVNVDPRYRALGREALEGALAVAGASADVLRRAAEVAPGAAARLHPAPPGVDVARFRPAPRREALGRAASLLAAAAPQEGRPDAIDAEVVSAVERRDAGALDLLAERYDQQAPDPAAAARLGALAGERRPLVGYFGKLIPQKGVELLIGALPACASRPRGLVVGFGGFREWLVALALCLERGDEPALAWLRRVWPGTAAPPERVPERAAAPATAGGGTVFTGRLDHEFAPHVLAAMDVLVVPSVLAEAFGMVAAEGAAAGALPLVARHSGLAEVAGVLEAAVGRAGLLSFEPGPGARSRLVAALDRILALPEDEREAMRQEVHRVAAAEWTWERTAARLLEAATRRPPRGSPPAARPAAPR